MLTSTVLAKRADPEPPVVVSLIPGGEQETWLKQAGIPMWNLGPRKGQPSFRAPIALALRRHFQLRKG